MRPARALWWRHANLGQQFAGIQCRLVIIDKKFVQAQDALALAAREHQIRVARDQARAYAARDPINVVNPEAVGNR